jgi:hypothetical protein
MVRRTGNIGKSATGMQGTTQAHRTVGRTLQRLKKKVAKGHSYLSVTQRYPEAQTAKVFQLVY